jgi:hypothetical protein
LASLGREATLVFAKKRCGKENALEGTKTETKESHQHPANRKKLCAEEQRLYQLKVVERKGRSAGECCHERSCKSAKGKRWWTDAFRANRSKHAALGVRSAQWLPEQARRRSGVKAGTTSQDRQGAVGQGPDEKKRKSATAGMMKGIISSNGRTESA